MSSLAGQLTPDPDPDRAGGCRPRRRSLPLACRPSTGQLAADPGAAGNRARAPSRHSLSGRVVQSAANSRQTRVARASRARRCGRSGASPTKRPTHATPGLRRPVARERPAKAGHPGVSSARWPTHGTSSTAGAGMLPAKPMRAIRRAGHPVADSRRIALVGGLCRRADRTSGRVVPAGGSCQRAARAGGCRANAQSGPVVPACRPLGGRFAFGSVARVDVGRTSLPTLLGSACRPSSGQLASKPVL